MFQCLDEQRLAALPKIRHGTLGLHPEAIGAVNVPGKDDTEDGIDVGNLVDALGVSRLLLFSATVVSRGIAALPFPSLVALAALIVYNFQLPILRLQADAVSFATMIGQGAM